MIWGWVFVLLCLLFVAVGRVATGVFDSARAWVSYFGSRRRRGGRRPEMMLCRSGARFEFYRGGRPSALLLFAPAINGLMTDDVVGLSMARGWSCAVYARPADRLCSPDSLREVLSDARGMVPRGTPVIAAGLSAGAYECVKAAFSEADGVVAVASVCNGVSLEFVDSTAIPVCTAVLVLAVSARAGVTAWPLTWRGLCRSMRVDIGDLDCSAELVAATVRTLVINSDNDPFVPMECSALAAAAAARNPKVSLVRRGRGGHLGHAVEGLDMVFGFLAAALPPARPPSTAGPWSDFLET